MFALLLRPQIEDTGRQEAAVRASGLDWVSKQEGVAPTGGWTPGRCGWASATSAPAWRCRVPRLWAGRHTPSPG